MAQIIVDQPEVILVTKAGKTYRWTKHAWDILPQNQKDEYDYIGKSGGNDIVPIRQHQAQPQQQVIKIKVPIKDEEEVKKEIEEIDKNSSIPDLDLIDKMIKDESPDLRETLKGYLVENKIGFNTKNKTSKLIELYHDSKKQKNG